MRTCLRWLLVAERKVHGSQGGRREIILTRNRASSDGTSLAMQMFMRSVSQPSLRVTRRKRLKERWADGEGDHKGGIRGGRYPKGRRRTDRLRFLAGTRSSIRFEDKERGLRGLVKAGI